MVKQNCASSSFAKKMEAGRPYEKGQTLAFKHESLDIDTRAKKEERKGKEWKGSTPRVGKDRLSSCTTLSGGSDGRGKEKKKKKGGRASFPRLRVCRPSGASRKGKDEKEVRRAESQSSRREKKGARRSRVTACPFSCGGKKGGVFIY